MLVGLEILNTVSIQLDIESLENTNFTKGYSLEVRLTCKTIPGSRKTFVSGMVFPQRVLLGTS